MIVFNAGIDISYADSLDYTLPSLASMLDDQTQITTLDYSIDLDLTNKKVISRTQEVSFDGNIVWITYNDGQLTIQHQLKSKGQLIFDDKISRILAFVFYDRSEDKLYLLTLNRFFYPSVVNFSFNIRNSDKHQVFTFATAFDRWDLIHTFASKAFSYMISIPSSKDYDVYHDQDVSYIGLYPAYESDKYLSIQKNANIVLKNSISSLSLKLTQFGQDFTSTFNDEYVIQDSDGNEITYSIDSSNNVINLDLSSGIPKQIRIIPKNLQRIFLARTCIIINNVITLNMITGVE